MTVSLPNVTARAVYMMLTLVALTILAGSAFGQTQATAADLSGTVTDPNGAVVAGATVTAFDAHTGITRSTTSDDEGKYRLVSLPPGDYDISAEAPNFKKILVSGVRLTVGQAADLTLRLQVGEASAVVNVSAGFRLPDNRGILSVEALNLLDENFKFQNRTTRPDLVAAPRYAPDLTVLGRLTLGF